MWRFLVDGDGCIKFSDHQRYLDRMEARSQLYPNVRWSERKADFPNCDQCVQKMPFLIVQIILYSPPPKNNNASLCMPSSHQNSSTI